LEGTVGGEVAGICFSDSTCWVALLDNISAGVFRRQTYAKKERERVSHVGNAECLTQSPVLNSEAEKLQLVSSNWYYNYKRSMQNWGKTF